MDLVEQIAVKELVAEFLREHLIITIDKKVCLCHNEDCTETDVFVKIALGAEVISEDVITL